MLLLRITKRRRIYPVNSTRFLALIFFLTFSFTAASKAAVELVNGSAGGHGDEVTPFSEGFFELPAGPPGSFELLVCATSSTGSNTFLDPVPDSLATISIASCQPSPQGTCVAGIWGQNTSSPDYREGLCSWTDPTTVYVAGVFRWTGVDPNEPVTGIDCNTGIGQIATAPSINVEEGSGVVRVYTFGVSFTDQFITANEVLQGSISALALSENRDSFQGVFLREFASVAEESGPTGPFAVNLAEEIGEPEAEAPWRACTIGLSARSIARPIPTMSEWGMGVFVILTAAASIWAIRRRTRTA